MLVTWLFDTGDVLAPMFARGDTRSRMRLAAIYQVLKLAADEAGPSAYVGSIGETEVSRHADVPGSATPADLLAQGPEPTYSERDLAL